MVVAITHFLEAFAIAVLVVLITSPQLLHASAVSQNVFNFIHLF